MPLSAFSGRCVHTFRSYLALQFEGIIGTSVNPRTRRKKMPSPGDNLKERWKSEIGLLKRNVEHSCRGKGKKEVYYKSQRRQRQSPSFFLSPGAQKGLSVIPLLPFIAKVQVCLKGKKTSKKLEIMLSNLREKASRPGAKNKHKNVLLLLRKAIFGNLVTSEIGPHAPKRQQQSISLK